MKKIGKLLVLFGALLSFAISQANAQISIGVSISARIAPPELPVYEQPPCPEEGYLWQPGYWAYDDVDGYYWVPGVWIAPPEPGYLWTPAYWGYEGGVYAFHTGYWGPHVGFYGGINYGYGYPGDGFRGGRWESGRFRYNTAVVHVNTTVVHNVYVDRTVVNVTINSHASFNGPGGVDRRPRPEEQVAMRERHINPTPEQLHHREAAKQDRSQFAKVNGGHPAAAAMDKPGGRPINERGQVATNSKLGNPNARTNTTDRANTTNRQVNPNRSADSNARRQGQRQRLNPNRAADSNARRQGVQQRNNPNRTTDSAARRQRMQQQNRNRRVTPNRPDSGSRTQPQQRPNQQRPNQQRPNQRQYNQQQRLQQQRMQRQRNQQQQQQRQRARKDSSGH